MLQISRTLVVPLNGVNIVAKAIQRGDFSVIIPLRWPAAFAAIARSFSNRIGAIRAQLDQRALTTGTDPAPGKKTLFRLRLTSLTDVRLGLLLFAVADEAPLSFFALYIQDLDNPFGFLPDEVTISLPFVGYLMAALFCAPLARPLGQRIGYRTLFVTAALLTCVAKTGLFFSQDIIAASLWQSLNGVFFVFAMLACQDYALDMLPKQERVRSMAIFRAVLFSGVFAGTALGGILADRLGERPVFLLCAAMALLSGLLIMALLPRHLAQSSAGADISDNNDLSLNFRFLLAFKDIRFCILAFGIIAPQAIIDHVFISYLLALLMDAAGASITLIAQVMMIFFLALILAGHAGHLRFVSRNPAHVVAITTLLSGVALWIAGQYPSPETLLMVSVMAGATLGLSAGPITEIALRSAETRLKSIGETNVLGMVRVLDRGGAALAMIAAGTFAVFFGFQAATSAIGLYAIVAAAVFLVFAARNPNPCA